MRRMWRMLGLASAVVVAGCGWVRTRSDFERDPLVMSHLTHEKRDPMFASTDNELIVDGEERRIQAASTSRKSRYAEPAPLPVASVDLEEFRVLDGRLHRRRGPRGGWFLHYDKLGPQDPFGGEIRLPDDARLGIAREGDRVRVEGRVLAPRAGGYEYEMASISYLDDR